MHTNRLRADALTVPLRHALEHIVYAGQGVEIMDDTERDE